MAMRSNHVGEKKQEDTIVVQSGLPAKYLSSDARPLMEVISGKHQFDVKFGNEEWTKYELKLLQKNVRITQQPMGAYYSFCLDNKADMTPTVKKISGQVKLFC